MDFRITVEPVRDGSSDTGLNIPASVAFPSGADQIVFGRERNCDIVFPPEARIVGRQHGRLFRQPSGHYAIEAFGDHYIELDGFPAERGQNVRDGATIRLGDPKGPLLRVRLESPAKSEAENGKTVANRLVPTVREVLHRLARYQLAILAVLVVIVAAVAWIAFRIPSVEEQIATLQKQQAELASDAFTRAVRDTLYQSAYAVGIRRDGVVRPIGTAWPIEGGMLVTNAHVAELLPKPQSADKMVVLGGGVTLTVQSANIHPGYAAFATYVGKGDRGREFRAMTASVVTPSAYDVATLVVDRPEQVRAGLPLATPEELAALKPGDPLAYAGFPIECTGAQPLAAVTAETTPTFQFGNVTSITNFLLVRGEGTGAYLVQHSLPAAGGASGSPIVDARGHVVAVLSGGNIVVAGDCRAPNAVMVNYAQRVDLLDAVTGKAAFDPAAAESEWTKGLDLFNGHEGEIVAEVAGRLTAAVPGQQATELPSEWARLRGAGVVRTETSRYREHTVPVEAGRTYAFLAYGGFGSSMSMILLRGGEVVEADALGNAYASITFTAEKTEVLTLRVLDASSVAEGYTLHRFTTEPAAATAAVNAS